MATEAADAADAAAGIWHVLRTDEGKEYYYNRSKKVTQWEKPVDGYIIDMQAEEAADDDDAQDEGGAGTGSRSKARAKKSGEGGGAESKSAVQHKLESAGLKLKQRTQAPTELSKSKSLVSSGSSGTARGHGKSGDKDKGQFRRPAELAESELAASEATAGSRSRGSGKQLRKERKHQITSSASGASSVSSSQAAEGLVTSPLPKPKVVAEEETDQEEEEEEEEEEDTDADDERDDDDDDDDNEIEERDVADSEDEDGAAAATATATATATAAAAAASAGAGAGAARKTKTKTKTKTKGKGKKGALDVKWERKVTATFGTAEEDEDDGDVYYLNLETGETQWTRPDEYQSADERERAQETSTITFRHGGSVSVMDILEELGALDASGQAGTDLPIVLERQAMLESGEDEGGRCEARLRQIFLAAKFCGGAEEWADAVRAQDYFVVRHIYAHWGEAGRTPVQVRALTCVLLETFMKLSPLLLRKYVDGEWGLEPADFMANLEQGLHESSKRDVFSWLSLCYSFLTEVPSLPRDALPSQDTIGVVLGCLDAEEEDVFLIAAYVLVALNSHYGFTAQVGPPAGPETGDEDVTATLDHDPNAVVAALVANPVEAEPFGEALVHLLNVAGYPYDDPVLLGQLLYAARCLLSSRASRNFFHLNDLKVVVDILCGQIHDLPPDDEFRVEYVRILHLVIINSNWTGFARAAILEALDGVLAASASGMNPIACKCALRILLDCGKQLA